MNRWMYGLLALVGVGIVIVLVVVWLRPTGTPSPSPEPGIPSPSPSLSLPSVPTPTPTPTPCPTPGRSEQLSVLTFNIHGGLRHGRRHLDAIARTIRASRADVVLLQEVDRFRIRSGVVDQSAWLGRELGMDVAYGANKLRPPARTGLPRAAIGNAILSRFPLSGASNTHLPNRPGMELRGLLHAHLSVGGLRVSIYTTHLQHTSGSMRIEQAHAIRRVVDLDPLPKILGGDLNAEPDSVSVGVLERGGLADAWREVGEGAGLTVPASLPHRRIDYLLHGERIRPQEADTLWSGISDHRQLWARFQVSPAGTC
jgi:endonuclease/exonuclease/phosphatase family metal-dependent hydrolase